MVGQETEPLLDVPLRHGGRDLGLLSIGPRRNEPRVSAEDARLVAALAPHLAVVVRSSALTEELAAERERVTEATLHERDRLRRDLHDGLGPSLSGIALGLEAAAGSLDTDPATTREILARTRAEATEAVVEIRRVLDGLRPAALDRVGLARAVRETASALGMGRPGATEFRLDVGRGLRLTPSVEEAAFRILAESLTNVARHSSAQHCAVALNGSPSEVHLTVCDDGSGIDPRDTPGHGLESMRRRATELGGRISIAPTSPRGTLVTATLPLETP